MKSVTGPSNKFLNDKNLMADLMHYRKVLVKNEGKRDLYQYAAGNFG
jgi:hypothetical protein